MVKYGFLDILNEEMGQCFPFDYEINWDKKNHAVEVSFLLEVQNANGIELLDVDGESSTEDIFFEESVLFYNPAKSHFETEDYLTVVPYEPKKGLSREFLTYFVDFLKQNLKLSGIIKLLKKPEQICKRRTFIPIRDTKTQGCPKKTTNCAEESKNERYDCFASNV